MDGFFAWGAHVIGFFLCPIPVPSCSNTPDYLHVSVACMWDLVARTFSVYKAAGDLQPFFAKKVLRSFVAIIFAQEKKEDTLCHSGIVCSHALILSGDPGLKKKKTDSDAGEVKHTTFRLAGLGAY